MKLRLSASTTAGGAIWGTTFHKMPSQPDRKRLYNPLYLAFVLSPNHNQTQKAQATNTILVLHYAYRTSAMPYGFMDFIQHYNDDTMSAVSSQITGIWPVCSTVRPGAHQRKHRSSASLAFVRGIHW